MPPVTMYGMRVSGHIARTRSYFIKAGIPFCERAPGTQHFLTNVVPLAGGKSTMPAGVDVDVLVEVSHDQARSATRKFGVNPDTYEVVESFYAD